MSFTAASFWLAFFMQEMQGLEPLIIAVHFLPQAIAGLIWNVVAGSVLHRINNTLIMAVAALCYTVSTVLLSLTKPDSSYWAFMFPYLVLSVVGADFQFNVANVRPYIHSFSNSNLLTEHRCTLCNRCRVISKR